MRIPIRLEPLAGESLDSWLDAYAHRLKISSTDLVWALGLDSTLKEQWTRLGRNPFSISDTKAANAAGIACGVDPSGIQALWQPLARYGLWIHRRFKNAALGRPLRPMTWTRFCPSCLEANGGRWLAAWRLPWFLACPDHSRLLESRCPKCNSRQGIRGVGRPSLDRRPSTCWRAKPSAQQRELTECRHLLTAVRDGHPIPAGLLEFQAEMTGILDPATDESSLGSLGRRLVDVVVVATQLGLDVGELDNEGLTVPGFARTILQAHQALAEPGGDVLRAIALGDRPDCGILAGPWRYASPGLVSTVLRHRDPHLSPCARLRYRTRTAGRRPEGQDPATRLRVMPLALWPDWAIRARIQNGNHVVPFRIAMAAGLCLPGSKATEAVIADQWPSHTDTPGIQRLAVLVKSDPHGPAILELLIRLADELDELGSPIDYRNRRVLAADAPLVTSREWDHMCRVGGIPTGGPRKLRTAQLWLWETLTGGVLEQAPDRFRPRSPGDILRYYDFMLKLPVATHDLLTAHARRFLDEAGRENEPLEWSPAGRDVDVESLPGPGVYSVDYSEAVQMLHARKAPRDVAERLGITLEHLRHLIRRHPFYVATHQNGEGVAPRSRLLAETTPDALRLMIETESQSVKAIAAKFGVGARTVRAELVRNEIAVPARRRPQRARVDPRWLRQRYVEERYTLREIADQVGTSAMTIARVAREHGIEIRPKGTPSLRAWDAYPKPLAAAMCGVGAEGRIRLFQVCARTPSMRAAASRLKVSHGSLMEKMRKLEVVCDGRLIERRATAQHPDRLTELGRELLVQADEILGPNPDAPPDLPPLLAAVLATPWGDTRLRNLLALREDTTLAGIAETLGVATGSLRRAVQRIETTIGGKMLVSHAAADPVRLTPLGRSLREQAERYASEVEPTPECAELPPPPNPREAGRFGLPVLMEQERTLDVAALAAHDGATVLEIDVLDVQREDLRGARRGLVKQAPQRLLANGDV
ncbi:MAG TPA: TniQ family protein [Solirubrobacteraceae bacterium]